MQQHARLPIGCRTRVRFLLPSAPLLFCCVSGSRRLCHTDCLHPAHISYASLVWLSLWQACGGIGTSSSHAACWLLFMCLFGLGVGSCHYCHHQQLLAKCEVSADVFCGRSLTIKVHCPLWPNLCTGCTCAGVVVTIVPCLPGAWCRLLDSHPPPATHLQRSPG